MSSAIAPIPVLVSRLRNLGILLLTHGSFPSHSVSNQADVQNGPNKPSETVKAGKEERAQSGESYLAEELCLVDADHWRSSQVVENINEDSEGNPFTSRRCFETIYESTLTFNGYLLMHLRELAIDVIFAEAAMNLHENWEG